MAEPQRPASGSVDYVTPWFSVISKKVPGEQEPYYSLRMPDYVSVVAVTTKHEIVLVRQYRPAVEAFTLELPSGHVDDGQTPEESARRELREETGFTSSAWEFLGTLLSDTGRNENRTWCYLASAVSPPAQDWAPETGVETIVSPIEEVHDLILRGEFSHAINLAALLLATVRRERCLASLADPPRPT